MVIQGINIKTRNIISYLLDSIYQVKNWGIYVTADKIYTFNGAGTTGFDTTFDKLPGLKHVEFDENFTVILKPGVYYVEFNERASLPKDLIGVFQNRGSMLRMGAHLDCSLLTSTSPEEMGGILYVSNPNGIKVIKHARLGFWMFLSISSKVTKPLPRKYMSLKKTTEDYN